MRFLLKILLSAIAVFVLTRVLPGVRLDDYFTAIIVAVSLAFLNTFIKPILVFLTFPVTIITLGLFLLVINAAIILAAAHFIIGFHVDGWLDAVVFSVLLSVFQSILNIFLKKN